MNFFLFTWVVDLAADIGVLSGGWFSGLLIKRHVAPSKSRLWVMLLGAALVPIAALILLIHPLRLVLAVGMIAVLAHMAWLINLSALVVDILPKPSLGFTFGVGATGSALGGLMMNNAGRAATISRCGSTHRWPRSPPAM